MTTIRAVNWFVTQPHASLLNPLSRSYLAVMMNDADTAENMIEQRVPLRVATVPQVNALETVTDDYTDMLARLTIGWTSRLELHYLGEVLDEVYEATIQALSPLLWLRFRETDGLTAANSGSGGAALNGTWTPGAGAVGQTGQLGANEAYLYDGADSKVTVPASTAINNLTNFTYAALCNFAAAGEGTAGNLFADGNGNRILGLLSATPFRLNMNVWHTSNFSTRISAAGVQNPIANAWAWVFGTYTAADKTPRLYVGRNGAVNEMSYSTSTISSNALSNASGAQLIGNNNASTRTVDGLMDEAMIFSAVLSAEQMQSIVQVSRM